MSRFILPFFSTCMVSIPLIRSTVSSVAIYLNYPKKLSWRTLAFTVSNVTYSLTYIDIRQIHDYYSKRLIKTAWICDLPRTDSFCNRHICLHKTDQLAVRAEIVYSKKPSRIIYPSEPALLRSARQACPATWSLFSYFFYSHVLTLKGQQRAFHSRTIVVSESLPVDFLALLLFP